MSLQLALWASPGQLNQAATDLRAAADHISQHGWVQYLYHDGKRCCAAGALNVVCGDADPRSFTSRSATAAGSFFRLEGTDIATYNDSPGRTKDQVVTKLHAVADKIDREVASWFVESESPPVPWNT